MRKHNKKWMLLLLATAAAVCGCLTACKSSETSAHEGAPTATLADYERALAMTNGQPVQQGPVKTRITCEIFGQKIEQAYEIINKEDGFIAKEPSAVSDTLYHSADFENEEAFLLRFCYLDPVQSSLLENPDMQGYKLSAALPAEKMRDKLLQVSNLLTGYAGQAADKVLLTDCAYTAVIAPEGGLCSYEYTFDLEIKDTTFSFSTTLTLCVEIPES